MTSVQRRGVGAESIGGELSETLSGLRRGHRGDPLAVTLDGVPADPGPLGGVLVHVDDRARVHAIAQGFFLY